MYLLMMENSIFLKKQVEFCLHNSDCYCLCFMYDALHSNIYLLQNIYSFRDWLPLRSQTHTHRYTVDEYSIVDIVPIFKFSVKKPFSIDNLFFLYSRIKIWNQQILTGANSCKSLTLILYSDMIWSILLFYQFHTLWLVPKASASIVMYSV